VKADAQAVPDAQCPGHSAVDPGYAADPVHDSPAGLRSAMIANGWRSDTDGKTETAVGPGMPSSASDPAGSCDRSDRHLTARVFRSPPGPAPVYPRARRAAGNRDRGMSTDADEGARHEPGQRRVRQRPAARGRNVTDIFITHGHGDHFFATGDRPRALRRPRAPRRRLPHDRPRLLALTDTGIPGTKEPPS
jgi:hypothetical protein